jgi:hypothetical protein
MIVDNEQRSLPPQQVRQAERGFVDRPPAVDLVAVLEQEAAGLPGRKGRLLGRGVQVLRVEDETESPDVSAAGRSTAP